MDPGNDRIGRKQHRPRRAGDHGHIVAHPRLPRRADKAKAQTLYEGELR